MGSQVDVPPRRPVELYRYGWPAWVWRVFGSAGVAAAIMLAVLAWRVDSLALLAMALPLALPGLVLAPMVAVSIHRLDDGRIEVRTLAFWRRRLDPVRRGLPIHVDLRGCIAGREAFRAVFRVPGSWLRGSAGR